MPAKEPDPMRRFATTPLLALLAACGQPAAVDQAPEATASARPAPAPAPAPASLSAAAPTPAPPAKSDPALAVEAEGLRLFDRASGAAHPLPFGTPRARLLAALAFRGPPGTGVQRECGAGALAYAAWPDGLKLYFQRDRFTGWALDARAAQPGGHPALATAAGIGPGVTRAELNSAIVAAVSQTSLGIEFMAGGISGVLDGKGPRARVTDMWAGASCVMR